MRATASRGYRGVYGVCRDEYGAGCWRDGRTEPVPNWRANEPTATCSTKIPRGQLDLFVRRGVNTGNFCNACGVPKPTPKPAGNTWVCSCGQVNTGKFCAECGKAMPAQNADGRMCTCGSVNKGKFCPECGAKKTVGVAQYRCDKCGWEPEDRTHPPKFCPECGDPFDNGDMQ